MLVKINIDIHGRGLLSVFLRFFHQHITNAMSFSRLTIIVIEVVSSNAIAVGLEPDAAIRIYLQRLFELEVLHCTMFHQEFTFRKLL